MELRFDRLITLYLASPYLQLVRGRKRSIPILMYHSITDQDDSKLHPYYRTTTTPAMFAAQLQLLQDAGYTTCTLATAVNSLQFETSTSAKPVVITFDDGYADFQRYAFPLLQQHGFSATVFLPTAYIGDGPLHFKGKDCLTWAQVCELQRHGISFGSHTVTHPWLLELSVREIRDEVVNSKLTIEEKLGCAVDSFAYPYAFPQTDTAFKKTLHSLLQEAGYQNGVCTTVGRASRGSEPLFLERLPVNSCDDKALFEAKLAGGYDWIAQTQQVSKMVKARLRGLLGRSKPRVSNEFPGVRAHSQESGHAPPGPVRSESQSL